MEKQNSRLFVAEKQREFGHILIIQVNNNLYLILYLI